jgi:hypothetical protein
MSVTAGLWVVPADQFVPRPDGTVSPQLPAGGKWFDLDKAWAEFDEVLSRLGAPFDCTIGGDIWPEGPLHEEREGRDGTWLGFVSPPRVAEIAEVLRWIEPEEMLRLIAAAGCPKEQDDFARRYYATYFEHLREAYRTAAAAGAGLGVLLC